MRVPGLPEGDERCGCLVGGGAPAVWCGVVWVGLGWVGGNGKEARRGEARRREEEEEEEARRRRREEAPRHPTSPLGLTPSRVGPDSIGPAGLELLRSFFSNQIGHSFMLR